MYLLLTVATLVLMWAMKQQRASRSDIHAFSHTDTIRVAMQYAPGTFFMEGDSLTGTDYEALLRLGLPYKLFPITSPDEGLEGLRQGRYDVVAAEFPQTQDSSLAREFIFTAPVYTDRQVLVQLADSAGPAVRSAVDLDGHTVYMGYQSPMAQRIANIAEETGSHIRAVPLPMTSEQILTLMATGNDSITLAVTNLSTARKMKQLHPALDCSVDISLRQFQPWILRKNDTILRDTINLRLHI